MRFDGHNLARRAHCCGEDARVLSSSGANIQNEVPLRRSVVAEPPDPSESGHLFAAGFPSKHSAPIQVEAAAEWNGSSIINAEPTGINVLKINQSLSHSSRNQAPGDP
jgi:hypothetical protein